MKSNTRFINSVIEAARQNQTELPWTRGSRHSPLVINNRKGASLRKIKIA
jgi:hypothetical protein